MDNDFIHGDKFADFADVSRNWPKDSHDLDVLGKENQIIFCKIDYLKEIFEALRGNKKRHILITHNSDYPVNEERYSWKPECIVKWYGQNVDIKRDDVIPIPVGVERPDGLGYSADYPAIQVQAAKEKKIRGLVYMNHTDRNNREEREYVTKNWGGLPYVTHQKTRNTFKEYLEAVHSHKFVVSPRGNICCDAHRTWEAIYLGTIPIVKRDVKMESWAELPILIVNDWVPLPKKYLEVEYANTMLTSNTEKASMAYWINRIQKEKEAL
jgi:hypothetical protein